MTEFLGVMIAQTQSLAGQAEVEIPLITSIAPELVPFGRTLRLAEKLDLHLLEFARAEGKVARRNLIAKALADLSDAKRNLDPARIDDVLVIAEDALRR